MHSDRSLFSLVLSCPKCASKIPIPEGNNSTIRCELCDFEAKYNKHIIYDSYLKMKSRKGKVHEYKIPGDVEIGRDNRNNIILRDRILKTEERLPFRTNRVSIKHLIISKSLDI